MAKYLMVALVEAEPHEGNYRVYTGEQVMIFVPEVFEKHCLPISDPSRITQAEVDAMTSKMDAMEIDPGVLLMRTVTKTGRALYSTGNGDEAMKRNDSTVRSNLEFVLDWARNGLDASPVEAPPAETDK